MKWVAAVAVIGLVVSSATLLAAAKPKAKKAASSTYKTKRKISPAVAHGHTAKGKTRGRLAGRRTAPVPSFQTHPDPERYQQIQQSLADRGYFKGTVNGEWGDDSADALRRFQGDRKLDTDGKINALTLAGLGLGPQHDPTHGTAASGPGASSAAGAGTTPQAPPAPAPAVSALPNGTIAPPIS